MKCPDCKSELVERNVLALPNPAPGTRATFVRTALVKTCPKCDAPGATIQVDLIMMSAYGMLEETVDPDLTVAEALRLYQLRYPTAVLLVPWYDGPGGRRIPAPLLLRVAQMADADGALVIYLEPRT